MAWLGKNEGKRDAAGSETSEVEANLLLALGEAESWAELAAGEARKKRSEATEAARLLGKRGDALCPPGSAAPDGGELDDASQAFVRRRAEVEQVRARLLGRLGVLAGLVGDDARGLLGREQLSG